MNEQSQPKNLASAAPSLSVGKAAAPAQSTMNGYAERISSIAKRLEAAHATIFETNGRIWGAQPTTDQLRAEVPVCCAHEAIMADLERIDSVVTELEHEIQRNSNVA